MSNCPVCKKETVEKYKPFCSKRCADVDLGRWFNGNYAVEAVEIDDVIPEGMEDDAGNS